MGTCRVRVTKYSSFNNTPIVSRILLLIESEFSFQSHLFRWNIFHNNKFTKNISLLPKIPKNFNLKQRPPRSSPSSHFFYQFFYKIFFRNIIWIILKSLRKLSIPLHNYPNDAQYSHILLSCIYRKDLAYKNRNLT